MISFYSYQDFHQGLLNLYLSSLVGGTAVDFSQHKTQCWDAFIFISQLSREQARYHLLGGGTGVLYLNLSNNAIDFVASQFLFGGAVPGEQTFADDLSTKFLFLNYLCAINDKILHYRALSHNHLTSFPMNAFANATKLTYL